MAKLYVANTTKQNLELGYRMIEHSKPSASYFRIPAGHQDVFPFDVQPEDIDYLVKQWGPHGLVSYDSIDRTKDFVGLAYRIDKELTASMIQRGVNHNTDAAMRRSEEIFKESGVSLANIVANRAREQGSQLVQTEISVQEDFDGKPSGNVVARGVRVQQAA